MYMHSAFNYKPLLQITISQVAKAIIYFYLTK